MTNLIYDTLLAIFIQDNVHNTQTMLDKDTQLYPKPIILVNQAYT